MDAEQFRQIIRKQAQDKTLWGALKGATHRGIYHNSRCGDTTVLTLRVEEMIEQAKFNSKGCLLSKASAGLLTQRIHHETLNRSQTWAETFEKTLADPKASWPPELDFLKCFELMRNNPF